jgi:hypothetical protein
MTAPTAAHEQAETQLALRRRRRLADRSAGESIVLWTALDLIGA